MTVQPVKDSSSQVNLALKSIIGPRLTHPSIHLLEETIALSTCYISFGGNNRPIYMLHLLQLQSTVLLTMHKGN